MYKYRPPKDMDQTFRTLIYVAPRMDVDELNEVRKVLGKIMGKEYVKKTDEDPSCIHKEVNHFIISI